jgi:hypothetical protein
MTEAERWPKGFLNAEDANDLVVKLEAENDRLRAQLRQTETIRDGECCWCGAERSSKPGLTKWANEPHGYKGEPCPVFTPDGVLRVTA